MQFLCIDHQGGYAGGMRRSGRGPEEIGQGVLVLGDVPITEWIEEGSIGSIGRYDLRFLTDQRRNAVAGYVIIICYTSFGGKAFHEGRIHAICRRLQIEGRSGGNGSLRLCMTYQGRGEDAGNGISGEIEQCVVVED